MKATKKIVSVILAITLTVVAFVVPASAAKVYPLVIVDGIFSTKLYKNFGTSDQAEVFATDDASLEVMIKEIGDAFVKSCVKYGINNKDYDKLADEFLPVVNKYIQPIGFDKNGKPIDDTIGFYQRTKPMSKYTEAEKAELSVFATAYAEKFGEKNVYNFSYDWRKSPIDSAAELNEYIKTVKEALGVKKVNVVAYSMGANVVLSYLYKFGGNSINNLVMVSPAWQGTSLAGNVAINNIVFDMFTVENYLVQLANVSATTHIAAFAISYLATKEDLSEEYFGDINKAVAGILPRIYTDTIIPFIAGMPGFWSLIPDDYYEDGKEFLYGETIKASYEKKIDSYNKIQRKAKSIINDARDDGMKFGIVVGYNCQMIPISDEYEQSDTIIDVKYASGGATCSKYLQAFDDWTNIYSQKIKCGHNHVSWDYKVDASTCMFPEQTWFYKNLQHTAYNVDEGTTDVIVWLLSATKQYNVFTDTEKYPQFTLYNTYKRKITPIAMDQIIGDIDNSGAITTVDARYALKVAAGQKKLAEEKVKYGDIDEDKKITTSDAKDILSMAAGIDF